MTKDELRAVVKEVTGRDDKQTLINTALDLGLRDIARRHDFRCFVKTAALSASTHEVSLPSDFRKFLSLRANEASRAYMIELRNMGWVLKRFPHIEEHPEGNPIYSFIRGNTLVLAPRPKDTLTLSLVYVSKPEFPAEEAFDELLIAYAASYTFNGIGMVDVGRVWRQDYEMALHQAILDDKRTNEFLIHDGFQQTFEPQVLEPHLDPFRRY